jgi:cell division protein FtsL
MSRKKTHSSKTPSEKQYYSDFIRNRDYSPTVDESLKFEETTDENSEFTIGASTKRRRKPVREQFADHLHEFWFQYLAGGVAVVFIFLMVDSKVDFARLFEKTDNIEENIKEVKTSIKDLEQEQKKETEKINDKLKQHDLELKENQIKIENLEKRKK